jgi:hypothetical protein
MVNSPTLVGRARRSESRFCADWLPVGGWGRVPRQNSGSTELHPFNNVTGLCASY